MLSVPLGDRLGLPSPVLMTLLGIALAVLDFVPNVEIPPELILPALLPPLLYAAVRRTSWRQFTANERPIFLLAVALVFVTTACVAVVAHAIVPGLPIAAAVDRPRRAGRTARPGRGDRRRRASWAAAPGPVSILEGEGLFNDVTAIVLYHVAIAAAVSGTFPWRARALDFVLSAVVPWRCRVPRSAGARNRLDGALGDATLQIGLTLLVPYVSYVLAEETARVGGAGGADHGAVPGGVRDRRRRRNDAARRAHLLGDRRHAGHRRGVRADRVELHNASDGVGRGEEMLAGRRRSWGWSSSYGWLWLLPATWLTRSGCTPRGTTTRTSR